MLFTQLLDQITPEPSEINISPDWMQGRAAFGGLGAALVYQAMRLQVPSEVPVRCLHVSFVGPISAEPLRIEAEVLRQGKSVSQVVAKGLQNGETKIMILGSFGTARESVINVEAPAPALGRSVEQCQQMPYIEGMMPAFTQHFDFRYGTAFPFSGSSDSRLEGYVRFKDPEPTNNEAHLLALIDAWPPAALALLSKPAASSSLSWTIEFIQPQAGLGPEEFSVYSADIIESSNGYAHVRAKIWNEQGDLIAISQQTTTHFA